MGIVTHAIESAEAAEVYITAVPQYRADVSQQAEELFSGIKEVLRRKKAHILQERVFATQNALEIIPSIRSSLYGGLDDGVPPSWLAVPEGENGQIAGAQVHAICTEQESEVLHSEGKACGRMLNQGGKKYIALSGVSAPDAGQAQEQARAMLEQAECVLGQGGGNIQSVVRTWMWLGDILGWYKEFNSVRTRFFAERGLIKGPVNYRLPASTGIGIAPAGGAICALDLFAVVEAEDSKEFFSRAGEQGSPLEYGSAFSRALRAATPAGKTVYVSGTAAVDPWGSTEHVGDIKAQINSTISHVQAVLKETRCRDQDVVQAIAYCQTTEVEKTFSTISSDLPWPCLTVICDLCRQDLLFELEASACPGARS